MPNCAGGIEQAFVVRLDCPACPTDGSRQRCASNGNPAPNASGDEIDLRLPPPPPKPAEPAPPAAAAKLAEPGSRRRRPTISHQWPWWARVAGLPCSWCWLCECRCSRSADADWPHRPPPPEFPPSFRQSNRRRQPEAPAWAVRLIPVGAGRDPLTPWTSGRGRDRPPPRLSSGDRRRRFALSARIAPLVRVGDRLLLEDLGSTNGPRSTACPSHLRGPHQPPRLRRLAIGRPFQARAGRALILCRAEPCWPRHAGPRRWKLPGSPGICLSRPPSGRQNIERRRPAP